MEDILSKIVAHKEKEVAASKLEVPLLQLQRSPFYSRKTVSAKQSISKGSGVIAEHKRKSPSKGLINGKVTLEEVVRGYSSAGASAISVLTDYTFFGGTSEDLRQARNFTELPIIRKDFVIDPYQIHEAKAWGADFVLLIAACLSPELVDQLAVEAREIGLEVLLEVHNKEELDRCSLKYIDLLGVNNRNLKTFDVSLETSKSLIQHIPSSVVPVTESGINDPKNAKALRMAGFKGFLIGEHFMRSENPGKHCAEFIQELSHK